MMRKLLLFGVVCLALSTGCAGYGWIKKPTEAEKQTNYQNHLAGALIEDAAMELLEKIPAKIPEAQEPLAEIAQAGQDVKANAAALTLGVIGKPEEPAPYTPEASEEFRAIVQADAQESTPWYQYLIGGGVTFLLGGGAFRLLAKYAPRVVGGPVGNALLAVIEGISSFKDRTKDSDTTMTDLLNVLAEKQDARGARNLVRAFVKRVESAGV